MTDAEKAIAYDRLVAAFAEALRSQGWGTPGYRSYDELKAEVADLTDALGVCEGHRTQLAGERDEAVLNLDACRSVLDATKRALAACEVAA